MAAFAAVRLCGIDGFHPSPTGSTILKCPCCHGGTPARISKVSRRGNCHNECAAYRVSHTVNSRGIHGNYTMPFTCLAWFKSCFALPREYNAQLSRLGQSATGRLTPGDPHKRAPLAVSINRFHAEAEERHASHKAGNQVQGTWLEPPAHAWH